MELAYGSPIVVRIHKPNSEFELNTQLCLVAGSHAKTPYIGVKKPKTTPWASDLSNDDEDSETSAEIYTTPRLLGSKKRQRQGRLAEPQAWGDQNRPPPGRTIQYGRSETSVDLHPRTQTD
ncbi:hypothetical protein FRB99_005156 [Tulasnella sp. 403]|nr:hypothetical protein FRB99_005156 [Tulasnella sp. 403]